MKKSGYVIILILLSILSFSQVQAQHSFTLNGVITDAKTGEDLIGASVAVFESGFGTFSNNYGFYSLTLKKNTYKIVVSYIGYQTLKKEIDLSKNTKLNFLLNPSSEQLSEIVVNPEKRDANITSINMSTERLNIKQIEYIPVLFGEKDILKTIQLLPGISTTSEGSSGFSVRGGSVDQNLILLDEAPIYSASHLMGFFSVFNSDALKDISVYKGGIPAQFGGRISSVLDISMRDGNSKKFSASGGIGLISSRLTMEGPIGKNEKTSFIVSGRRSYADWVARGGGFVESDMILYFYDLNAKINHKINDNNRIYMSGYLGKDKFGYEKMGTDWGNTTATLRWNHIWNSKLFSNTTLIYSDYDYGFKITDEASMSSGIEDYKLKQDFSLYKTPDNTLKFGFSTTLHIFNPGKLILEDVEKENLLMERKQGLESAVYFTNYRKINDKLSLDYGLRLSMFNQFGEGWQNTFDNNNNKTDSVWFNNGELMQSYFEYEPRMSASYQLADNKALKMSYNRTAQYLHLLSNSTSSQPTDTWIPSTNNIKPLTAGQFAIGYFQNFLNNKYEFAVESYYKRLKNVTDYEDGTDILLNEAIESNILSGDGRTFGLEFLLKKKYGKFNGWISYTLSRSEKKIDEINAGKWYPTKYDKTHDISVVTAYKINKRIYLSANWVYYTGNAVTFPSGQYTYNQQIFPYYTERNGYRMPNYHRLDLNFHLDGKMEKRFETSWDFSIYNAYNKYNAYTIIFGESETQTGTTEATKFSLFGIVPSVTWNFNF
ncbi:TonB-dependent receptor [Prolixibacteraceae bacterium Z1-6]|uniref:TonB-dependent receptor n=1 Tax=Draconibacterium aestuarii TaxID=2998507 RepID=A0A9X3J788_9BACT|nr:TonB-dependent receptor [Prolixibacteraceae bacterium Z1-6]